jgi:drug/metabolite transporter (DMT)-like permease
MPKPLQLYLVVFVLSLTGIIGKVMEMPAPSLVAWRTALAALGAAAWLLVRRGGRLMPPPRALARMLGVGLIIGAHWMCFFGSIQLANVSVALAAFATTSLFTAFTEPLIDRRRVRPFEILLGLIVLAGLSLVAGNVQGNQLAGLGVGLAGAVLAAIFPVLNRRIVLENHDPMTMVLWEMIGACLVCLAAAAWMVEWPGEMIPSRADLGWVLVIALLCTVFAHGWHIRLLRSMSAYTANLAMNFEPVYGMLLAALLFHEYQGLNLGFYTGAAAIVLANVLHPIGLRRARGRNNS